MNINLIYRHPCELEIESLLSREEPYPDTFTLADRTTERLTRARTGLVHVMNEILPSVGGEQATVITSWLQKVTSLIDISLIDAESASMTNIQLIEAQCRIEQVQTVLGFWLEGASPSNRDKLMIGAVMSLLNGVPEAIQEADELLGKYELQNHSGEAKHE